VFLMYRSNRLVVLMYMRNTLQHRTRAKRGPEESRLESSDPMREADEPSTGGL
jgi:hypothetical protein